MNQVTENAVSRKNQRGQSLVEIALITPLLLIALYIPMDFGIGLFMAHLTQNAVREGARIGTGLQKTGGSNPPFSFSSTEANTVKAAVNSRMPALLSSKSVTVNFYDGTGCMEFIEVTAQGRYNFLLYQLMNMFGGTVSNNVAIARTTQMRYNYQPAVTPDPGNNYVDSPNNEISRKNVTLIHYDPVTRKITQASGVAGASVGNANGARVALENSNPYGGTPGTAMTAPLFLTPLLNLLGMTTPGTANVSVSAVAVIQALPGLPIVVTNSLCGTNATLDFQSGGTAGWETYYIDNASTDQVRNLWKALPFCSGQPLVDIGYCGNVSNGVNQTIVDATLKPMFQADPKACYLIPVVKTGGNFNQCQTITDWASFCPACKPSGDCTDAFPKTGQLKGTVTCGQTTWDSRDTKCYVPSLVRDTISGM